jgi:hypothetical protein
MPKKTLGFGVKPQKEDKRYCSPSFCVKKRPSLIVLRLNFSTQYQHRVASSRRLDAFLKKISEKNQPGQQTNQANRTIQFYQNSLKKPSVPKRATDITGHTSTPPGDIAGG